MEATTRPAAPRLVAPTGGHAVVTSTALPGEVVYEVDCALDPAIVADFDAWLPGHVQMVLGSPGFLGAELLRPLEPSPDGRVRRVNRYRVRDRAALDTYLEQLAPALRQDGAVRFGDRAAYTRRVLASTATALPAGAHARCANCDARLSGPYCGQCGQHARDSARSLGTLFHDAWHVLTHVDGRLWQTLRRLAFSPGVLTNEYFRERRASYIPPFRLYLVLSLLFFGVASLTSVFEQGPIQVDPPSQPTPNRAIELDGADCDGVQVTPKWLEPAARDACRRARQDGGRALAHAFVANIPKMMFVFLPLMAALMLLLYWRPRRYYVEHLVFYLHVHAALFLALTVVVATGFAANFVPPLEAVTPVLGFAAFVYAAWYVWRSMRVHYGDGRALNFAKFAIIAFCYVVFLAASVAGTALVSALTA